MSSQREPVTITYHSIGVIYTPFTRREGMPIQAARSDAAGRVEVFAQYREALADLDGFSHVMLLYHFHQTGVPQLTVRPFLDDTPHGLFSTRHPHRPNAIGLSVVQLERVEIGAPSVLHVLGVDMLDGSPLLDIKPYVPAFDVHPAARTGWLGVQGAALDQRPWEANFDGE
jgi:tRNA-Thr(GGU) m(6)t(6)A37 methyltransferase TsaA